MWNGQDRIKIKKCLFDDNANEVQSIFNLKYSQLLKLFTLMDAEEEHHSLMLIQYCCFLGIVHIYDHGSK